MARRGPSGEGEGEWVGVRGGESDTDWLGVGVVQLGRRRMGAGGMQHKVQGH